MLTLAHLTDEAERLIGAVDSRDLTGDQKRAAVVEHLVAKLDDMIEWGPSPLGTLAECADGPVLKAIAVLAEGCVERAYERWRRKRDDGIDAEFHEGKRAQRLAAKAAREGTP